MIQHLIPSVHVSNQYLCLALGKEMKVWVDLDILNSWSQVKVIVIHRQLWHGCQWQKYKRSARQRPSGRVGTKLFSLNDLCSQTRQCPISSSSIPIRFPVYHSNQVIFTVVVVATGNLPVSFLCRCCCRWYCPYRCSCWFSFIIAMFFTFHKCPALKYMFKPLPPLGKHISNQWKRSTRKFKFHWDAHCQEIHVATSLNCALFQMLPWADWRNWIVRL